jgi:hypothetical protein
MHDTLDLASEVACPPSTAGNSDLSREVSVPFRFPMPLNQFQRRGEEIEFLA